MKIAVLNAKGGSRCKTVWDWWNEKADQLGWCAWSANPAT